MKSIKKELEKRVNKYMEKGEYPIATYTLGMEAQHKQTCKVIYDAIEKENKKIYHPCCKWNIDGHKGFCFIHGLQNWLRKEIEDEIHKNKS